jgi:ATP-binding cassette subfamily C protein
MSALMNALFSVFNYALLFWYSWKLALVATGITLVAVLVCAFAAWRKLAVQREMMEVEGKISGLVLQLLVGISKLRVAGAERRAFSQWAHAFAKQKAFGLRAGKVDSALDVFNAAFPVVSSLTIFYAVLWVAKDALTDGGPPFSPGDFIAFNSSFGIFLSETLQMTAALMSALVVIPVFERAKPILTEKPEVDTTKLDPGAMSGKIEVDRVTFRYHPDGPAILDDVTVRIEAGEFVAIVGPSGSGKSTLLRMMLGLEVPQTGGIYYDGRDVQLLDVQKLRRKIGVVTQNAAIRAGSILANIIGSLPLSVVDAWAAARMAGLDDDIKAMPMGMNTMLTQGGQTLSGGQRQRLMIARAIVTRPRILFFDEATSALDNRTQAIVSQSLKDLQATRVVIAHRLTTIMHADRIYVLQGGKLVQMGSYQDLAEAPGLFQDLIKRQVA